MSHRRYHLATENLLRSQRDIAREEAATRMGDPPNTACRLKLALGARPNLRDKMADHGRKALRPHLIGFVIAAAWFLPWSLWFLVALIPWALYLGVLWSNAPKYHAAELQRRGVEPATDVIPVVAAPEHGRHR